MVFARPRAAAVALLLTSIAAVGCTSRQTGKLGNLEFSYTADDRVTNFNKPIAIGGKLDVRVRQKGNNKPVTITACSTADDKVLKVDKFEPSFFTLEGVGKGFSEITVKAQQEDGQVVEDKVDMRAATPEVLKMHHYCTKDDGAYYLTEQTVYLPYDLEMADGEAVISYGYHPIDFEPKGALTLFADGKNQAHFKLRTPKVAQTVTVNSTIDKASLVMSVVGEGQIDGARHEGAKTVLVGTKTPVLVRPTVSGKPVCQADTAIQASSMTPDICGAKALSTGKKGADETQSWGWIEIEGIALGKCTFEVNHLKANAGKGLTTTYTISIAKLVTP